MRYKKIPKNIGSLADKININERYITDTPEPIPRKGEFLK
jgi:hypothetical protein